MAESKLTDLIAKLEAAAKGSRELDALIWIATDPKPLGNIKHWVHEWAPGWRLGDVEGFIYMRDHPTGSDWPAPEFTTSLDAIVALIERKLPGSGLVMAATTQPWAQVYRTDDPGSNLDAVAASTLPLALCIALLSALQLQGGSEQ